MRRQVRKSAQAGAGGSCVSTHLLTPRRVRQCEGLLHEWTIATSAPRPDVRYGPSPSSHGRGWLEGLDLRSASSTSAASVRAGYHVCKKGTTLRGPSAHRHVTDAALPFGRHECGYVAVERAHRPRDAVPFGPLPQPAAFPDRHAQLRHRRAAADQWSGSIVSSGLSRNRSFMAGRSTASRRCARPSMPSSSATANSLSGREARRPHAARGSRPARPGEGRVSLEVITEGVLQVWTRPWRVHPEKILVRPLQDRSAERTRDRQTGVQEPGCGTRANTSVSRSSPSCRRQDLTLGGLYGSVYACYQRPRSAVSRCNVHASATQHPRGRPGRDAWRGGARANSAFGVGHGTPPRGDRASGNTGRNPRKPCTFGEPSARLLRRPGLNNGRFRGIRSSVRSPNIFHSAKRKPNPLVGLDSMRRCCTCSG